MAKVQFLFQSGVEATFINCRVGDPYKGRVHVYPTGPAQGKKALAVIHMRDLHSKEKTGKKGIIINKY
jgi:hypothetical protein